MTPDKLIEVVAWRVANSPQGPFAFRKTKPRGWAIEQGLVLQSDLAAAQARVKQMEESREELRKACAQVLGYNDETWPAHGNSTLAICAALALRVQRIKELESALTDLLPLAEQSHVGGLDTKALLDAARKALTGDER